MRGFCVWLTGLSGAGKSTLAQLLAEALTFRGVEVGIIDGDAFRRAHGNKLGFSRADRQKNVRLMGAAAKELVDRGQAAIVAAISPYRDIRAEVRESIGNFLEVYVNCPIEVCAERDPKGLYRRAAAGLIKGFTGIDDPYEAPTEPDVELRTDLLGPKESLAEILGRLETLGFIPEQVEPLEAERIEPELEAAQAGA